MAIDIEEGGAASATIEGATCVYVLSVVGQDGLEVSVYSNSRADLGELKEALKTAVAQTQQVILLRADSSGGAIQRWQALEPDVFVGRLPS